MHKTFSGHQHKSFAVSCFVWGEQSSIITSTLINITITSMLFLFLPNIQVSKDIWNIGTMEKSDFQNSYLCLSIIILQLSMSVIFLSKNVLYSKVVQLVLPGSKAFPLWFPHSRLVSDGQLVPFKSPSF